VTDVLDSLLTGYDRGLLDRRQLLQALAVMVAPFQTSSGERAAGVLRGRNLNHVNLQVADVDRSVDYYRRLFSLPPKRLVPDRPDALDLADGSFLSIAKSDKPGAVSHFCVGVDGFSPEAVAATLKAAGLDRGLRMRPDSIYVSDPDGISVQISTVDWKG
jgi:catechol 2,3-dioxygenase-like lactoylglutathione lyase family enzyme